MKKIILSFIAAALMLGPASALALESGSQSAYEEARSQTQQAGAVYTSAKTTYQSDRSAENSAAVVETGKDYLQMALDEAEAWLLWKNTEAQNNAYVSSGVKAQISSDVAKHVANIDNFRNEVDAVNNQVELAAVTVKMVGAYAEFLTDVARNTGAVWVSTGDAIVDKVEDYEARLRSAAEGLDNYNEIIAELDLAQAEIAECQSNINAAEESYQNVVINNKPAVNFSEGNQSLLAAKADMQQAHTHLEQALNLILNL